MLASGLFSNFVIANPPIVNIVHMQITQMGRVLSLFSPHYRTVKTQLRVITQFEQFEFNQTIPPQTGSTTKRFKVFLMYIQCSFTE